MTSSGHDLFFAGAFFAHGGGTYFFQRLNISSLGNLCCSGLSSEWAFISVLTKRLFSFQRNQILGMQITSSQISREICGRLGGCKAARYSGQRRRKPVRRRAALAGDTCTRSVETLGC